MHTDIPPEALNAAADAVHDATGEFQPISVRYRIAEQVLRAALPHLGEAREEWGIQTVVSDNGGVRVLDVDAAQPDRSQAALAAAIARRMGSDTHPVHRTVITTPWQGTTS